MSYNACQNMFSIDQVGIMEFNLNDVSWLDNMVTNAATTGVFQAEAFCLADFDASGTDVCPGSVVDFTDFSFYNPTNWTWSVSPGVEGVDYNFVGGTGTNSQNPSIEFVNAGSYDISLTSGDGITSDSEIKTGFINVLPNANEIDLIEGFEGYTDFASTDQWTVYNPEGSAWEITSSTSHMGSKCARLFNFGQPSGRSDELISAPVDLSVIDAGAGDQVTLSFRYAYRKRYASNTEWLKVFCSANCGETWAQRKTLFGDLLSPLTYTSSWTPAGLSDWTTVHMTNITSAYHVDNFLYKFEFESDGGNNFYLDNINIYAGPPSEELVGTEVVNDDISGYNLFPNPVDDQLNVRFEIAGGSVAKWSC